MVHIRPTREIARFDSSHDAIYLHTPNPNRDNFPYEFIGVEWNVECPELLKGLAETPEFELGRCTFNGNVTYWVRKRRIA